MLGVLLAGCGIVVAASLFLRSSDAPARAPASLHLRADADRLLVVDGATLRVGDQVVRLQGIVAPAHGSLCQGAGVDCGVGAANALAALVRGGPVACDITGRDGQGRPVGVCSAGGKRLSEALVRDGWARADGAALRALEATARDAGRGIWGTGR